MALNSRYLINVCPSNNPCAGISYPHSLIFGSCINTAVCPIWQNLASMVELCHAGFSGKICQRWNKVALLGREVLAVILFSLFVESIPWAPRNKQFHKSADTFGLSVVLILFCQIYLDGGWISARPLGTSTEIRITIEIYIILRNLD